MKAWIATFDEARSDQGAELAKTDLTTELVKEFTELQGVIGGLYARAQGLGEQVAQAIYDQYTPRRPKTQIPVSVEGQLARTCRPHPDDRGDVRHWQCAHWIEGSVCAAARRERNREDSCRVGAAADA